MNASNKTTKNSKEKNIALGNDVGKPKLAGENIVLSNNAEKSKPAISYLDNESIIGKLSNVIIAEALKTTPEEISSLNITSEDIIREKEIIVKERPVYEYFSTSDATSDNQLKFEETIIISACKRKLQHKQHEN
jgi:hypothetical protein